MTSPQEIARLVGHTPEQKEDIVERLRADVFYGDERLARMGEHSPLHLEAIAEILRLRTALRAVRETLKQAGYQTDPDWAARLISDALRETKP